MKTIEKKTSYGLVAVVALAAAITLALCFAGTARATGTTVGYNAPSDADIMDVTIASSATTNGSVTGYALGLTLGSTENPLSSFTERYVAPYFKAPTGCGYCWDASGCGVPGTCPDAFDYCACYSTLVNCEVSYYFSDSDGNALSSGPTGYSIATVGDYSYVVKAAGATSTSVYVTALTEAPSPNDTLSDGSGEPGPNAYGRMCTTYIALP